MEDDEFFEHFRNKDFSKVKKFNFKQAKVNKSPEKPISPLNGGRGGSNSTNTSAFHSSTNLVSNSINTDCGQLTLKNKEKNVSYPFSCLDNDDTFSETLKQSHQSPAKKFTFKRNDIVSAKTLPVQKLTIPIKNRNELKNMPPNSLNEQICSKKFSFRKEEIGSNIFSSLKGNSPIKKIRADNFLDSLYKSTDLNGESPTKLFSSKDQSTIVHDFKSKGPPKLSLSLKKNVSKPNSVEGSPSLLSGQQTLTSSHPSNISRYFNSTNNIDSKKTGLLSPFKKLLQSKKVESSSDSIVNISVKGTVKNTMESSRPIEKSDSGSLTESPVIKPKKFNFKKRPISSSSSEKKQTSFDLDHILIDHPLPNKEFSIPSKDNFKNNHATKLSIREVNDFEPRVTTTSTNIKELNNLFDEVKTESKTQQFKSKDPDDFLSDNHPVSSSQSMDITDADYMDDEEFERRFGSLAEEFADCIPNSTTDLASTSKTHKGSPKKSTLEPDTHHSTDELLNEISQINWSENDFEDEPVQEGFKDRNDDSGEFRGQYEHSEVMMEVLHQKFGLRSFRPHQREIINASLTQHDCFVLMPTGGGKSLCYQLPATLMPGVTVIISPLIALICDQVDKLNALDIAAAHLCSNISKTEGDHIYMKLSMREPAIKLLYLTPEKIISSRAIIDIMNSLYQRGKLARFVIDEVHCVSQWGHDFRQDYKQLGQLRKNYKDVPIICLTATATKQVENDVINILKLRNVKKFIRSFNRPNIKYEVIQKGPKATDTIADLIKTKFLKKSGIVYCLSRKDCESLADDFIRLGIKAKPYHAGMNDKVREVIQREWMQDRFHVIVATIAFGMGIDKPDVRFVIHNSIPKSVEAFYQESGRAGRDGEVSYSYLFYSYRDVRRLQSVIQLDRSMAKKTLDAHFENLNQMVSFAENVVDCRRHLQLIHLGEHFDRRICIKNKATTCDNCENIDKYKPLEVTKEAKDLCAIVKDLSGSENVTMLHVADIYRGAKLKKILDRGHDKHTHYGGGASMDRNNVQRVLKELTLKHVLQDFSTFTGDFPVVYIQPGPKFFQFYNSDCRFTISVSTEKREKVKKPVVQVDKIENSSGWVDCAKASTSKEVVRHSVQKQNTAKLQAARKLQVAQLKVQCHEDLLEECRRLAMERNLTLSSVMNLSAIKSMSDHLPSSKEEMLKIQHVTVANYNKYGEYFLKITQKFREKTDALQPLTELTKDIGKSAQDLSDDEESDFHPNSQQFGSTPSQTRGKGVKRKGGWAGKTGGFKRRKGGFKKRRGKTPKAASSGWKDKGVKSRGAGGLGYMPVHIK